jgi:ankyrin repeat protein
VAHSDAKSTDQRSFVDRLFKAYPTLVAAAKDGDVWKLQRVMDDAYAPAPDATTKKIRDAQIRAAALEAISSGKHETLLALLDRGADLGLGKNDDDDAGGEWARAAAAEGHAGVLDALIEKCGVSVRGRDAQTGRTPLLCAAANGREACIARIVSRLREEVEEEEDEEEDGGSDVFNHLNATDFDGNTAAMLAAENDRAGCLNQLRGCGCDLDIARASDGATAMEIHRARVRVRLEKAFKKVPSDHNARRG